ncbi:ferritin-like domain-containing protein [Conexibacter sp. JD483]|uniref:ferritin-like domain-containing protein n=1 Tax=unclassified Conexibacter TaxID=2627773 RepID=UPI002724DD82|nr:MULTISPECIES: ferritin-like domain-containing protein [unclassified Conexibacter]MDO8188623.1 ferritin-like domain-containing protein [Conexibacter sp. CPCC 205706]MDO8201541.1 ferritin-like domain-containing protein [Conexibacter sp. CPCC 205762]MDR9370760.1 ferritin-like domain-containing protein [Conexibacter sp. JD483]
MFHRAKLAELDRDDAILETAADAADAARSSGTTRAAFLTRGGLMVGAGLGLGSLPIALAGAQGGLSSGDVRILNYALTLEYLEAAFYADALKRAGLRGNVLAFARTAHGDEQAHVDALKRTLGGKAVKRPRFDFMDATGSQDAFLRTAMTLEDTGVSAYQGQAPNIASRDVLAAAGAILAVEARHAAWVADLIGRGSDPSPAPDAFSPALDMNAVLAAVRRTGFIQ